jgi:hypothetical protein
MKDLIDTAIKMAEQSEQYTKARFSEIADSIALYYNHIEAPLPGLYNAPVPILPGFIDTLISRISDVTTIRFDKQNASDATKAKKITAM